VTGLNVVIRGYLVLFPARERGFPLLKTMQIGCGSHGPYYLMGAGDKVVEVSNLISAILHQQKG